ncbi:endonuclease/exonuclease/phosphatase family protein [Parabacteroides segnis]|uniref:endonuclease/exonuclease/phosphatase family protein n=1 Tax=Parabacteroides segnis TaxID=2763058 RepID=UPI00351134E9
MKYFYLLICYVSCFTLQLHAHDLKIFQINIWNELSVVERGDTAFLNEINRLDPEIVLICEIRTNEFISSFAEELRKKGKNYYGVSHADVGILSKYEITESKALPDVQTVLKACLNIKGEKVIVYSAHLDYTHYACYLPRGYDGVTWKKLDAPATDIRNIEKANKESLRDEAIQAVIIDAKQEQGKLILLGGDFNEPSHLDWQKDTKDHWDHHGTIVNWDCSFMLSQAGFKDAYRTKYPNPLTHPGFTYPANNTNTTLDKLDWVPEADGRDRIDFIYYKPTVKNLLKDVTIVGPAGSIVYNKRTQEPIEEHLITPLGVWPSDHRGILATFTLE